MPVPERELPSVRKIRELALRQLPDHYRLLDVRCDSGSGFVDGGFDGFQVVVEYETSLNESETGSSEALNAHHRWAEPLIEAIRAEWPPSTIQIVFQERSSL